MSSLDHCVTGEELTFDLAQEIRTLHAELEQAPARVGRTLSKDGPLRVTLVGIRPGHEMHEHRAPGPITIQVLEGEVTVSIAGRPSSLGAGRLLALDGGVPHSVRSEKGGVFLLTVMHANRS